MKHAASIRYEQQNKKQKNLVQGVTVHVVQGIEMQTLNNTQAPSVCSLCLLFAVMWLIIHRRWWDELLQISPTSEEWKCMIKKKKAWCFSLSHSCWPVSSASDLTSAVRTHTARLGDHSCTFMQESLWSTHVCALWRWWKVCCVVWCGSLQSPGQFIYCRTLK